MSFSPKSYVKVELYTTASDAFTLGVSKLGGTDKLSSSTKQWIDITDNVIRLNTTTGPALISGVYTQPQPGTLSLDLQSADLDPNFNLRIRNGLDIRVTALTTPNFTFWYGRTTSVYATYLHDGQNIVTIQATDLLSLAMNGSRTSSWSAQTAKARFEAIMSTLGFTSRSIPPTYTAASMAALTLDNRSLGDMLTELAKCELGIIYWIADPFRNQDGYVVFDDRTLLQDVNLYTPEYYFSDVHSTSTSHSCYSSIDIGADLDRMTNSIYAAYATTTTTVRKSNADQVALYGTQQLDITLELNPVGTALADWVDVALARPIPRTVKRIQARAVGPTGVLQKHVKATVNETASIIKTIGANTIDTQLLISNVSHSIDSDGWFMDIELWSGLS